MNEDMVLEAASKTMWIQANNLPGPAKMCRVLADPACTKQLDWLWVELGSVPVSDTLLFRQLILAVRRRGCKAVIFFVGSDILRVMLLVAFPVIVLFPLLYLGG